VSKNDHKLDKARFDVPLHKNYDYGEGFYQNMQDYKSVKEFLKKRKKKNKKSSLRTKILKVLLKHAIDFPVDDSFKDPIQLEENNSIQTALPMGGLTDEYLPENDNEDKMPTTLNFGEDYQNDGSEEETIEDFLSEVNTSESPLLGLPDGLDSEDKTADKTISNRSSDYGTTNSGNTLYDKVSF
jgi:hypothetical protein